MKLRHLVPLAAAVFAIAPVAAFATDGLGAVQAAVAKAQSDYTAAYKSAEADMNKVITDAQVSPAVKATIKGDLQQLKSDRQASRSVLQADRAAVKSAVQAARDAKVPKADIQAAVKPLRDQMKSQRDELKGLREKMRAALQALRK